MTSTAHHHGRSVRGACYATGYSRSGNHNADVIDLVKTVALVKVVGWHIASPTQGPLICKQHYKYNSATLHVAFTALL